jgi:hypothetical protein
VIATVRTCRCALAERHGVHRRTVRAALASPLPPAKRVAVSRPAPKLGAYRELIDAWLLADVDAPRKQRHTSKRIWRRLVDEYGPTVLGSSRVTSACTASSKRAPGSITTSSCSRASPAGWRDSVALAQQRGRGAWPDCFDELWAALASRYGRSNAAAQLVDVILLCRDHGPDRVELAVRGALAAGAIDGRAVGIFARRAADGSPPLPAPLMGDSSRA